MLHWLVGSPSLSHLLEAELWLSFLYASYNGAMVVYLAEVMPAEVRATGFSLAYSLATALFGGFTPAICSYLIHATGDKAMPGVWLTFAAVCGLIGYDDYQAPDPSVGVERPDISGHPGGAAATKKGRHLHVGPLSARESVVLLTGGFHPHQTNLQISRLTQFIHHAHQRFIIH